MNMRQTLSLIGLLGCFGGVLINAYQHDVSAMCWAISALFYGIQAFPDEDDLSANKPIDV